MVSAASVCIVWSAEDGACVLVAGQLVFYAIVSRSMLDDFFQLERRVKASTVGRCRTSPCCILPPLTGLTALTAKRILAGD